MGEALSETFRELVWPETRSRVIIWIAFHLSIVWGFVLLSLVNSAAGGIPNSTFQVFFWVLSVLGVLTAIGSRIVPPVLLPDRKIRELMTGEPDLDALSRGPLGRAHSGLRERIEGLSKHEQRLLSVVRLSFVPFVVSLAFGNAVALYGFVLAFLFYSITIYIPFALVGLALNLTVSPKLDSEIERAARLAPV